MVFAVIDLFNELLETNATFSKRGRIEIFYLSSVQFRPKYFRVCLIHVHGKTLSNVLYNKIPLPLMLPLLLFQLLYQLFFCKREIGTTITFPCFIYICSCPNYGLTHHVLHITSSICDRPRSIYIRAHGHKSVILCNI